MADLSSPLTCSGEIIITERITANEFIITDVHESIRYKFVKVDIEFAPFNNETTMDNKIITRGTHRKIISIWEGDEYDKIADTWDNAVLLDIILAILNAEGNQ